jgi:KUP system potassium uptake protein
MVAVMILVLGFKSSNNLAAAYGIAVTGDMVITSILATVVVAHLEMGLGAGYCLVHLLPLGRTGFPCRQYPENSRWRLVPAGRRDGRFCLDDDLEAWPPVARRAPQGERLELSLFLESLAMSMPTRVAGTAIFLNADPSGVPHAMLHNLMHNKVLHERVVLVSVKFFDVPYVPDIDRVEVKPLRENFWSVIIQYGFKDEPNIPAALALCADAGIEFNPLDTSYFIGRETLIPRLNSEMAFWREKIFVAMFRNGGSATAFFKIPSNRVVELGTQVVL